ncbi:hypothetical protein ASO20_00715 [Mycoplasma sp. (ex Biomphalaria glabrata)]|uniref:ribulose-phosphate 3-epimerase n=1 Tax=Mycoplasma sp. (ex Biomphalaria glabrata) TaxID=1749074 RepID=UPI00073A81CF|nr:ribulose-phosphate 3-epimerase [Mycoplasma sp. (ex Biomphalaria glabrata)]ALV23198.1 hypothetical protein ASO20_00715 [Mycoplasma sp. (ex Biomphalaria glabrata)]
MNISVSTLDINYLKIKETIDNLYEAGFRSLHLDVMDGNFVPQVSYGPKYVKDICEMYKEKFDLGCHLMVRDPIRDFPFYEKTGITTFMFHFESLYYREIKPFITDIKAKGIKPGIVINPKTNIEQIYEYLPKISSIMVMSVEPGYGGQPFQESTYARVEKIAKYREAKSLEFEIIVDGGINPTNAKELKKLGANTFVVGSYIWKASNYKDALMEFDN